MKTGISLVFIAALLLFSNCTREEEFKTITSVNIAFVYADGTMIAEDGCINPVENYALLIETTASGNGEYIPTQVEYTINGVIHSVTFTEDGSQVIPVELSDGINIAQLVEGGQESRISYILQDDWVLVE